MKKLHLILIFLITVSLSAYAQDTKEVRSQIEKLNNSFAQAMMDNNIQIMLDSYDADAISLPSYQPMIRGFEGVKKSSEGMLASGVKTTHFTLTTTDVFPAGDYYIEIGKYDMRMLIPGMADEWPDNGKYVNIWKKHKDGSLKIFIETWNTDNNPWVDMGMGEDSEMGEHHQHEDVN